MRPSALLIGFAVTLLARRSTIPSRSLGARRGTNV